MPFSALRIFGLTDLVLKRAYTFTLVSFQSQAVSLYAAHLDILGISFYYCPNGGYNQRMITLSAATIIKEHYHYCRIVCVHECPRD